MHRLFGSKITLRWPTIMLFTAAAIVVTCILTLPFSFMLFGGEHFAQDFFVLLFLSCLAPMVVAPVILSQIAKLQRRMELEREARFNRESNNKREHLDYLRSVIEAIPGLVTIFDHDLRYRLINSKVTQFTGVGEDQFIGKELGFNTDTKPSPFTDAITQFIKSDQPTLQTKIRIAGRHDTRWFLVNMSRLQDKSQIVVVSIDIEDQVKNELLQQEQQVVAESAARLALVGELSAGVAHEINNPLAIITGYAEQAMRKIQMHPGADLTAELTKIRETGFRIARVIRGLRALSRNGDKDPVVDCKIFATVEDVLSVLNNRLKEHSIELKLSVSEDLVVRCVPTQIGQLIMNLLSNAIDAVKHQPGSWVQLAVDRTNGAVEISVTDSGLGIPTNLRDNLMKPFFTTKPAGTGTGLGLSICRRIAIDHGGEFFLDGESKNTRFVLRLPSTSVQPLAG